MIELKVHEGHVADVGIEKIHGYEILCPICYSKHYSAISGDEFYRLIGKAESRVKFPLSCGHEMSADDLRYKLILVDEWIANQVSRINQAGYLTKACCSGHASGHGGGYLSFVKYHDNLKDYIDSVPFLSRFLRIERFISVGDGELELREWDSDLKVFTTETVYFDINNDQDNLCIRLKTDKFKSKFEKLQLFRKLLNQVAKWCEENKISKE